MAKRTATVRSEVALNTELVALRIAAWTMTILRRFPLVHKKLKVAVAAFVITLLGLLAYIMWPQPLEKSAERVALAKLSGDAATLYRYAFQHEKRQAGLTEEKLDRLWKELILPRLAGFRAVGDPVLVRYDYQGLAYITLRNDEGLEHEIVAGANLSEEGHRAPIVSEMLGIWILEHVTKAGLPINHTTKRQAWVKGSAQDMAKLKEIGIPGLPSRYPDGELRPWQKFHDGWKRSLEQDSAAEHNPL